MRSHWSIEHRPACLFDGKESAIHTDRMNRNVCIIYMFLVKHKPLLKHTISHRGKSRTWTENTSTDIHKLVLKLPLIVRWILQTLRDHLNFAPISCFTVSDNNFSSSSQVSWPRLGAIFWEVEAWWNSFRNLPELALHSRYFEPECEIRMLHSCYARMRRNSSQFFLHFNVESGRESHPLPSNFIRKTRLFTWS